MIFYLIITILCIIYAVCIFFEKGPLLSVSYFMMDKEMKKKMKTREECRFLCMIFAGIASLTVWMTIAEWTKAEWMGKFILVWAIILVLFIFIQSLRKVLKK